MPGLDVVRGAAIAMVIVCHGVSRMDPVNLGRLSPAESNFLSFLKFGASGVHLFFVLSGFLITGILLDTRHNESFYKPFYMRRVLRIVPAYVLMIAVLKVTGSISWRFTLVSLLYLCNLSGMLHAIPEYSGFWSLSVEEQFYLVWPVMVRKLSVRALVIVSVAIVALTPFLRLALMYGPKAITDINYKTWDVGDFFAAGALLAMLIRSGRFRVCMRPIAISCTALGVVLLTAYNAIPQFGEGFFSNLQRAFYLFPFLPLFSGVVLGAYLLPGLASLGISRPFIFLGKISYGLYIVHPFIFDLTQKFWPIEHSSLAGSRLFQMLSLRIALETGIAILIAYISRVNFEEFFLRLKPREKKTVENLSIAT